jgi:cell division cycle 14
VENGDLNWHQRIPDPKTGKMGKVKWLAFAGPHETREVTADGYQTLTVDDYGPYFKKMGITLVVRLNKKYYDERKFAKYGIRVFDLYYLDGSNPSPKILSRFLEEVENNEGGIAVHCKAGLGRTGTCIGCYLMKHYKLTAAEVIGWMRLCRPGT